MDELNYLRNEMNQRIQFFFEHSHKTIAHVLLMWGGSLMAIGAAQQLFDRINVPAYFVASTICFISFLYLYYTTQKDNHNVHAIIKIASYIAVFYEKRAANIKSKGDFYWEIATLEIAEKDSSFGKRLYKMNNEYFAFACISFCFILFFSFLLVSNAVRFWSVTDDWSRGINIFFTFVSIFYIALQIKLLPHIHGNSSMVEEYLDIKKAHCLRFVKYAKETEYYTDQVMSERFGDNFLQAIGYKSAAGDEDATD